MKITDPKTGQEIEVFTSEEVETKVKETVKKAVEEFQTANPDKAQELEDLKNKLADVEAKLQAAENGNDDEQIKRLRKERDDAKKMAEEATKDFDKKFDEFRKEVVGDTKSEWLDKLSKGDADLKKKIELEFDNYKPTANSKKDVAERMEKAFTIVTGNKPNPGFMDGIIGSGDKGDGGGYRPSDKKEWKPNEIAIGKVLGVNEKDREEYLKFKNQK